MSNTKTQKEFEQEVLEKFHGEYEVLGQYINNKTKILIKHNKCGNTFMKNPKDMVTKLSGCPYCNGNKPALYNEQWVKDHTTYPYQYISGYKSMREKCKFYCNNCKITFMQHPRRIIIEHIYGCECCPTKLKTNEQFLEELGPDCLKEYKVIDEYINADTPITFKHLFCNTEFKISPDRFLHRYNKKYCPICYFNKSRGELWIAKKLNQLGIKFIKEYQFKNLPKRRFDFFIPSLNTCIEFDGQQHIKSVPMFGGEEGLINTQKRDAEKNKYCIDNNIILFRIPYVELKNIDQIIEKLFKEKSSETIEKFKITE